MCSSPRLLVALVSDQLFRIVRDYEKYIARQFKRGTSRQELNVSWLKKNELDLKRHATELRDSVRNNWSTTGQELTKELRQFWQSSRPGSPARGLGRNGSDADTDRFGGLKSSPAAHVHLAHLDIPRPESPGGSRGASSDFATGYSLGLIGGVRSWVGRNALYYETALKLMQMTRSRTSLRGSQPGSGESEDDSSDAKSSKEEKTPSRGRRGEPSSVETADIMDTKA